VVRVTRRLMWSSTTPHGWPTSRCCRTRGRQPRWSFCCGLWLSSMARALAARGCFPITAAPIARNPGEKPAQHLSSHQNAPGHTSHELTVKPSGSSSPFWRSSRSRWPTRRQKIGTAGCRTIWRAITAAGVTWPWLAAPAFSSSECCDLLNDLVRKHT